jgi:hypothetical protein
MIEALIMHGASGVIGDLSEHFGLGDDALWILVVLCSTILTKNDNAAQSVTQSKFVSMLTELWGVYQSIHEALDGSDGVQAFIRKKYKSLN